MCDGCQKEHVLPPLTMKSNHLQLPIDLIYKLLWKYKTEEYPSNKILSIRGVNAILEAIRGNKI
jgi:hypothetical protein